jgi:hypothetical protein
LSFVFREGGRREDEEAVEVCWALYAWLLGDDCEGLYWRDDGVPKGDEARAVC